ncbi:DUF1302 domain-containing protein [Parahaliea sp. F7430]|uniref:DUF1302 domain-containing protein n=1 Tax=Sediminihaliea albiluteola TaxID=2758564 RepID=A0A7W2TW77_9GAMM|nr:DUF1302 domain-containing protein [Sediminihaliea albiluteola]MBA6413064.1 DUF1302 domain-containing protein [Sediminihaliea albiluteola]
MKKAPARLTPFPRGPLIAALAAASLSAPASALTFELGPFEGNLSTNLSVGASWRTEAPDNGVLAPGNTNGRGSASSSTADDGNLNYDRGDLFSLQFRGIHDLELAADNYGIFTRLKYWYDYEQGHGEVPHGHIANGYRPNRKLDTSGFERLARYRGIEFLDYYAYGSFEVAERPLELRAGNMVLSWGESTFIQNGINVVNPFDVTALRKPGSEIKEALLPVGMVYANYGLTYDLSVEGFVQYDWQRTVLDECGTYWSAADPYGGGCDILTVSNAVHDRDAEAEGFVVRRSSDVEASDSGQWGLALRYYVEALNATEFGLYYMNYHSRTPILSATNATQAFGLPINFGANPEYFFEFPEDIELWGLTFATNLGDWAVSGELSHRPDFPLQINTTDILQTIALGSAAEWSRMLPRSLAQGPGAYLAGYDDVSYTQFQMTFIKFFEQVLGAQRLSFASEIGAVWLGGMNKNINYGRSPAYGVGDFAPFASEFALWPGSPIACDSHPAAEAFAGISPNSNPDYCTKDGFTDDFSWGYRIRAGLEYSDAFAGINLTPNIAWSHDVKGTSPAPNFVEDRIALSLGVTADYLNMYRAELSYTSFFGADYDELKDRDFVSLSFSVAF